ncbi:gfo/Idh/MocA family oxidoreductase [Mariniphaga sediminis]|uniref:Gfo/Idh/MocA family oxidoreductase n=1 Tax=Mariniphaga sediminis TaxID=1628158 RepID=A0A399CXI6_9BACT|nr:Gfo/Idh/MocA family oxidoreductase [Mariniphaga sediminis]RIH64455.1 gfo/Idh/MocA family oxidoreductase [Mariniphaga sediminis]
MNKQKIRILQVGAGSMGSRRIRDLLLRPDITLSVLDKRKDRLKKSVESFGIQSFESFEEAIDWKPDVLSISTPPDQHDDYIHFALENGLHHFCEAQLWTYDFLKIKSESQRKGMLSATSCSMHFLPIIKQLKLFVNDKLGDLHAYQMYLSTYMPSWHPDEGVEYYARHRNTAAGREMVPFELLYLNEIFGIAEEVVGSIGRRSQLGNDSEMEDTWCLQMNLAGGSFGQLVVLQASPSTVRKGVCSGTNGRIEFDIYNGKLTAEFDDGYKEFIDYGSQKDVIELAYKDEINTFVDAVLGKAKWPLSYYDSALATATLAAIEKSATRGKWEKVDPRIQPEYLLCQIDN